LKIFKLSKADGGGEWEIAGINTRFHPHEAEELARLILSGRWQEADERAADYIAGYTDVAENWEGRLGPQMFLRDTVFNRGARGAAKILQRALNILGERLEVDGRVGPLTRAATRRAEGQALVRALRAAREDYEREVAKRNESSEFWQGLVNRWNKVEALALNPELIP